MEVLNSYVFITIRITRVFIVALVSVRVYVFGSHLVFDCDARERLSLNVLFCAMFLKMVKKSGGAVAKCLAGIIERSYGSRCL